MKDRIKTIRKQNHLTQREFAEKIGVTTSCVGAWEIGRFDPGRASKTLICSTFNVRREWLEKGEGEMLEATPFPQQTEDVFLNMIIAIFRQLSPCVQDALISTLQNYRNRGK